MENYSFGADLLHTFRIMSDGVKVLLIYMPCVFALGFTTLYMHHLRQRDRATAQQPKSYSILPPEGTWRHEHANAVIDAIHKLDNRLEKRDGVMRE